MNQTNTFELIGGTLASFSLSALLYLIFCSVDVDSFLTGFVVGFFFGLGFHYLILSIIRLFGLHKGDTDIK